jgi:hypothetical protein
MIKGRAVRAPQSFFTALHKVSDGVVMDVIA